MKEDKLHGSLQVLYDQLKKTRSDDPQIQERIDRLATEIRRRMEEPRDMRPEVQRDFLERMRRNVEYFEGTHPELTSVLNNLISTLASAGL